MKKYKFTKLQLEWINTLLSGKYRKAKGYLALKDKNKHVGYCCLGIACLLSGAKKYINKNQTIFFGDEDVELSEELTKLYKLRSPQGMFKNSVEEHSSLAALNDTGWSHKRIGEYILNNPENVFLS